MTTFHLDQLQYSQDRKGPWALYIYESGIEYHRGPVFFRESPQYPHEEITTAEAKRRTVSAMAIGRQIRVCDPGDMLVFHAQGGQVLYGDDFWKEIGHP